ncbi:MAG: methyltransferase domain-containing protein [Deinococcota bacterium]
MTKAMYNQAADFYTDFVQEELSSKMSVLSVVTEQTVKALGSVAGCSVCDVACGEGHVSRRLASQGAQVTGVDISQSLLDKAKQLTPAELDIQYIQADAQSLNQLDSASFDYVVSNMALMDIADHKSMFDHCWRIVKDAGVLVVSMLHPCFESPFDANNPPIELTSAGNFLAARVRRYLEEGHWSSGGNGVRGKVGAYHRTLSTYINDLLNAGFRLDAIYEPSLEAGDYKTVEEQWFSKIPKGLVIKCLKQS